ncbi:MAG: class B sortase [Lachnospiraceae bacterium]|nr:class B sortase [Lachnospiraceae bacterium]
MSDINNVRIKRITAIIMACAFMSMMTACGSQKPEEVSDADAVELESVSHNGAVDAESDDTVSAGTESAEDTVIDFESLTAQNDEIFAWLKVPGTNIDYPVLQSTVSDTYYSDHNVDKNEDPVGSVYIEIPTMKNMCDFNTVIHGSGGENGLFTDLVNFQNPEFFEENDLFYVYLPDNLLTYRVWAVYERDNTSMIRDYSFVDAVSDREFISKVLNDRVVGKQIREDFADINEYNFLTTLSMEEAGSDKQLVVIGVLVGDAAGTIDRMVIEELDLGPLLE